MTVILSLSATTIGIPKTIGPWSQPSAVVRLPGARYGQLLITQGTNGTLSKTESNVRPSHVGGRSSYTDCPAFMNPIKSHGAMNLFAVACCGFSGHVLNSSPTRAGRVRLALLATANMTALTAKKSLVAHKSVPRRGCRR